MPGQPTISEMSAALSASTNSMTPVQHFERMVRNGIINSRGEVTRLVGGDAEPEPGSRRPAAAIEILIEPFADAIAARVMEKVMARLDAIILIARGLAESKAGIVSTNPPDMDADAEMAKLLED